MNSTLFGYPKTGKTTLFNLLTGEKIEVQAYEEGKKEPHLKTCPIPDERLNKIWSLYPEKKKKPALIDFIDLAGISYGEIKSSAYLNYLRKAESLVHVVRGFTAPQIPHPKGRVNPKEDILYMEEELVLADLVSLEARLEKLEKELKRSKDPEGERERELLERLRLNLEQGKGIRETSLSPSEERLIRSFTFLSLKPLLHMINIDEKDIQLIENPAQIYPLEKKGTEILVFCGKIEMEILELEKEEKEAFLVEYGIKELSSVKFLRTISRLLDSISFFTIGKDEVRAWAIKKNTPASQGAGAIHTDMEKGFIRAEVIPWQELIQHGSLQMAKEKGAIRLEGKDYIIQDGDVIYFRFAP